MAATGPFLPGDLLFPAERMAEGAWAGLTFESAQHASVLLNLADRRARNLRDRAGTEHELLALAYLDAAIDDAVATVASSPAASSAQLRSRLASMSGDALAVLDTLTVLPSSHPDVYANAKAKVEAIRIAANDPDADLSQLASLNIGIAEALAAEGELGAPRSVPFPPNSTAAAHQFFPLTGKHATLACSSCHTTGQYKGTPGECTACHADKTPTDHFEGDCASCHTAMGWKPAMYNHSGTADCISCHSDDEPANHFDGQCSDCHRTAAWKPVNFNHIGAADCAACHADEKPAKHFEGQCSNCHAVDSWKHVKMDHNGLADCLACHTADAPANHWSGQCSLCHSAVTWTGAVFNHTTITGADCAPCHSAPDHHFGTPCGACHRDTANWSNASFDHSFAGGRDCAECHKGREPANHFGTPCGACHRDTANWSNASFDHSFAGGRDCAECHKGREPAN
ncbi:MAG: cytochrome c3 family protein, partial [Chloroflexi bacterium]|nr:cytochrome c3 family protein [Chloroflexota bacterium]